FWYPDANRLWLSMDGRPYLYADSHQFWRTDAATTTLTLVKELPLDWGSSYTSLPGQVVGDRLVLYIPDYPRRLVAVDDTPGTPTIVKEFSSASLGISQEALAEPLSKAIFYADDGIHGTEPWITDGTPSGTHMLLD